ncbi:MAG: glycosyltransferase family 4 protein [Phaeodactylibacter xiamenensis]|uniref:glycosyltransferase family 4 protein n=1 Tax=Phaeodactylibacter xiamenensis TaxID=1524460 RepID=UPI0006965AAF|nr:glycosyltransferase family 1 protein [Phaeodactylibacter xiamenensis]MCR9054001.1 glycosyltransferase family 4 protein [bacterium]
MKVTLFFRKAFSHQYSIEQVFEALQGCFPETPKWYTLPFPSKGLAPRLKNGLNARRQQGVVNHVTGDITYITPFLERGRTVVTFHDFEFLKRSSGLKRRLLFWFWVFLPARHARYITTISEATKKDLLELAPIPEAKIAVIPNPLTLPVAEAPIPSAAINHPPVVLHIGTKANKNLEGLIRAIEGLSLTLDIVGKLTPVQKALLEKHRIRYHNAYKISKAALVQKYRNADALAFVSTLEGFGLPIVEAQALGCPVITSNCSSMPEVAGSAACMVDPSDTDSIRTGVQRVLNDPAYREQLVAAGFENVKRFEPARIAQQYWSLYQKVSSANG